MRAYAGIGSRQTPVEILRAMTSAATQLSAHDLVLRSGAAHGADAAFELGADPEKVQIFLPWKGFNNHSSPYHNPLSDAFTIAEHHHPAWDKLTPAIRQLMARNVHQVLGPCLQDPVLFVLCWTPNGNGSGGTGQALRVAKTYGIPVYDMGSMELGGIAERINHFVN